MSNGAEQGTTDETVTLKPGDDGYVAPPDETLVVAIGGEPSLDSDDDIEAPVDDAGTPPSQLVKDLRTAAKTAAREKREAERQRDEALAAAASKTAEPPAVVVGDKPTLEGCEYDAEKFAAETLAWDGRKREAEAVERKRAEARTALETEYATRLGAYKTGAATLKVTNFDAAEKAVEAGLTKLQQSIIVKHAKNSALLVYALGNDPVKLKELGAIQDPVAFGIAAANIEKEIKTVKKSEFGPEKQVRGQGSGTPATGSDALTKARAEAEKTGDYSKVHQIRKAMKTAGKTA